MRVCNCVGYLTNPGGRCCMDLNQPSYPFTHTPTPMRTLYGWACPKCGAVYAPSVAVCWNCQPSPTRTEPTA